MVAGHYYVLVLCIFLAACASNPNQQPVRKSTPQTDVAGERYNDCIVDGIKKYWRTQETAGDVADAVLVGCDPLLSNLQDVEENELMLQAPSASARRYVPSAVSSSVQRVRKNFRGDIIRKVMSLRIDASKAAT